MTRRTLCWLHLALAGFVLAGCGDRAPGGDGATDAGSAAPPDSPLLSSGDIALVERFSIEPSAGLERPRDVTVDGQGNVYVLDFAGSTRVLKYDSTGAFRLTLGQRDENPDRIVSAIEIDASPWNTVLVLDRGKNALLTYLSIGTFASSVNFDPGIALDVHALPEFGEFYVHKWIPERQQVVVMRMRDPADSLATPYQVSIPPGLTVRRQARGVHFLTAVDRWENLYVGFYDGYPVRVLSPNGETLRLVDLDRAPVPKPEPVLARERVENRERLQNELPGLDESLLAEAAEPDTVLPLIEELVVDPLMRLWVRTNREDAGDATPYDVFNEAGVFLARVDVPGKVDRTAFGPDGALYVIASRDGEPPTVTAYDVRLGGGRPGPASVDEG